MAEKMTEKEFLGIEDKEIIDVFVKLVKELTYKEFFLNQEKGFRLVSNQLESPRDKIHIVEFIYLAQSLELDEQILAKVSNWHNYVFNKGIRFVSVDPHESDIFKATSFNHSKK